MNSINLSLCIWFFFYTIYLGYMVRPIQTNTGRRGLASVGYDQQLPAGRWRGGRQRQWIHNHPGFFEEGWSGTNKPQLFKIILRYTLYLWIEFTPILWDIHLLSLFTNYKKSFILGIGFYWCLIMDIINIVCMFIRCL